MFSASLEWIARDKGTCVSFCDHRFAWAAFCEETVMRKDKRRWTFVVVAFALAALYGGQRLAAQG
jgi:hypothetical protein